MKAKISIVIPVYNAANFLRDCLDSVFSQTFKDIELICVNDGSTDTSQNILDEYATKHPNMVIIEQENRGIGSATNRGIKEANGEYLYSMDNDDTLANNEALSFMYDTASEYKLDILTFNYTTETQVTRVKQPVYTVMTGEEYLLGGYIPPLWSKLCRLEYVREIEFKFLENISFVDTEAVPRLLLGAQRIMHVDKIIYRWRRQENESTSISQNLDNINSALAYAETTKTYNEIANKSGAPQLKKAMLKERFKAAIEVARISAVVNTNESTSVLNDLISMDFSSFEKFLIYNEMRFFYNTYVLNDKKLSHPFVYFFRKVTKMLT